MPCSTPPKPGCHSIALRKACVLAKRSVRNSSQGYSVWMIKAEPIVDHVLQVDADVLADSGAPFISVRLGESICFLDRDDPRTPSWKKLLENLKESHDPVFLEVHPKTGVIERVLLPKVYRVKAISERSEEESLEVELTISQAKHYLNRANPAFADLLARLRSAQSEGGPILVTETSKHHEIMDVRSVPVSGSASPTSAGAATVMERRRIPA